MPLKNMPWWLRFAPAAFFLLSFFLLSSEIQEASEGQREAIATLDQIAWQYLGPSRREPITYVALNITALGSYPVLAILVFGMAAFLFAYGKRRYAAQILMAGLGSIWLTRALKSVFHRQRPQALSHLAAVGDFSYPSGHSLSAAAVYVTVAIIGVQIVHKPAARLTVIALCAGIVALIGASRVYLGVHYVSDVLAGFLCGTFLGSFLAAGEQTLGEYLKRRAG